MWMPAINLPNRSILNKVLAIAAILMPVCLAMTLLGCWEEGKEEPNSGRPPNIVLIVADDLGYGDLGCYGQKRFQTPEIDQLASDGLRFTQFYAGSSVCAPSRAALMTGLHTGHTGIRGNKEVQPEGQFPMEASALTLAEQLKKRGYVTGAYGKWGLGYPGSEGDPNQQGFDEFFGYNCQRIAHNYYPYHLWENQKKVRLVNNAGKLKETYAPEIIHSKALSFIEANKDTTFFLYYPTLIPHDELAAPDHLMSPYRGRLNPETPYVGTDEGEGYKTGGYGSQAEPHAAFAAMVDVLDGQVGELRAKLEALGIDGNTLIIFTSDNGPHLEGGADPDYFDSNGPLRGYKRDLYEGGIRVPLIAFWPGMVKPDRISNHVSAFWDIAPTLFELAGTGVPDDLDGISFLPELLGRAQEPHEYLYWEFHEQGGKQAARMGKWKAIRLDVDVAANTSLELYNLEKDPGEVHNIVLQHPEIAAQMEGLMNHAHETSSAFPFQIEGGPVPVN
jgi:arylsulfatase A-like enzyme